MARDGGGIKFGVLRERAFALLFSAQLISASGDVIASVAVPFAILQLGGSARDIGLVLAAQAIPLVLFLLIGGVWSDRIPRRTVMMASDAVRGVCQTVFAVILVMGVGGVWAIAAIMFVYGSAEAFFRPALSGVVPQAVSADRLQEAYGLVAITPAVGMVLGGVLGGVAVAAISPAGAIAIDAASFAVGSALLALSRWRSRGIAISSRALRRTSCAACRRCWEGIGGDERADYLSVSCLSRRRWVDTLRPASPQRVLSGLHRG